MFNLTINLLILPISVPLAPDNITLITVSIPINASSIPLHLPSKPISNMTPASKYHAPSNTTRLPVLDLTYILLIFRVHTFDKRIIKQQLAYLERLFLISILKCKFLVQDQLLDVEGAQLDILGLSFVSHLLVGVNEEIVRVH